MKQQLCCNRTISFNSFFYKLPINIIFPLSVVYGIMGGALLVCMNSCIGLYAWMYVDLCIYVCRGACIYVYTSGEWLSMSNGNKLVDLLWGKYLLFTSSQDWFFTEATNFTEKVALVATYVGLATALPVKSVSVSTPTQNRRLEN